MDTKSLLITPSIRATVSIEQASELMNVSRRTIYYWIKQGKLEIMKTINGSSRIYVDSLKKPR